MFDDWVGALLVARVNIVIAEIAGYEVRRELVRLGAEPSVARLNRLRDTYKLRTDHHGNHASRGGAVGTDAQRGRPLADPHALDADVILAAAAEAIEARGHDVTIATTNLSHLATVAKAALWHEIRA